MFTMIQHDSAGNMYVSIFNEESSGPFYSYVKDANGRIISEMKQSVIIETPIFAGFGELFSNEINNWRFTYRNSLGWA